MIQEIIEQHASEAGFLWNLRDAAARDPHYLLSDVLRLDERVEGHLDGLRLAGAEGWAICAAALEEEDLAGEVFVAAAIAIDRGDLKGIARVLDVCERAPDLQRGVASALGWLPFGAIQRILPGLLHPDCPPPLHWMGIAACSSHRQDPGPALRYALYSDDLRLRARALQSVGELARADLSPEVRSRPGGDDESCRFWAAWTLWMFGAHEATEVLVDLARGGGRHTNEAAVLAVRRLGAQDARALIETLAARPETARAAVVAGGALGSPTLVPWLLSCMEIPEMARLAGESFTLITGADLAVERLSCKAPEGFRSGPSEDEADPRVALDPDENLPWPEITKTGAWWGKNRGRFSQERYLVGQPITSPWAQQVLRQGYQRQRAAASLELAIASPGQPYFDVCAPGSQQRRLLG